jgi:hypothetical protein
MGSARVGQIQLAAAAVVVWAALAGAVGAVGVVVAAGAVAAAGLGRVVGAAA